MVKQPGDGQHWATGWVCTAFESTCCYVLLCLVSCCCGSLRSLAAPHLPAPGCHRCAIVLCLQALIMFVSESGICRAPLAAALFSHMLASSPLGEWLEVQTRVRGEPLGEGGGRTGGGCAGAASGWRVRTRVRGERGRGGRTGLCWSCQGRCGETPDELSLK